MKFQDVSFGKGLVTNYGEGRLQNGTGGGGRVHVKCYPYKKGRWKLEVLAILKRGGAKSPLFKRGKEVLPCLELQTRDFPIL